MGVQVIPIPTEVVSHSLPSPFPILCFIPIHVGFPWDSRSHWECHSRAHLYPEGLLMHVYIQAGCSSCRLTNSAKAPKGLLSLNKHDDNDNDDDDDDDDVCVCVCAVCVDATRRRLSQPGDVGRAYL